MSPSTLTKNQTKTFRADYVTDSGPETLIVTVRHDDCCGNGYNTFSITGVLYTTRGSSLDGTIKHATGRTLKWHSSGCLHEVIAKRIPELAPLIKWHLCSTNGPLHYIANTTYLAGDRDHRGFRKAYGVYGVGKERDLDAARRAAIWPDATDEELMADDLKERLEARLPALLTEFRAAVESLGFTY